MLKPLEYLKKRAKRIKAELYTLYLAGKHPRTPWYVKGLAIVVIAYAVSPIDLIPDFIPILGFLDDIILLPIGIYFTFKLIPKEVLSECREELSNKVPSNIITRRITTAIIILIWIGVLVGISYWVSDLIGRDGN